jgi:hypothetical protein
VTTNSELALANNVLEKISVSEKIAEAENNTESAKKLELEKRLDFDNLLVGETPTDTDIEPLLVQTSVSLNRVRSVSLNIIEAEAFRDFEKGLLSTNSPLSGCLSDSVKTPVEERSLVKLIRSVAEKTNVRESLCDGDNCQESEIT